MLEKQGGDTVAGGVRVGDGSGSPAIPLRHGAAKAPPVRGGARGEAPAHTQAVPAAGPRGPTAPQRSPRRSHPPAGVFPVIGSGEARSRSGKKRLVPS